VAGNAGSSGGLGAARGSTPDTPGAGSGGSNPNPGTGGGGSGFFTDVPRDHWAYDTITSLAAAEVILGSGAQTFDPQRAIRRAEFAALLARALNLPAPAGVVPAFRDVTPSDWFYDAVRRVVSAGFMVGVADGLFGPELRLTRQEAAAVAQRVAVDKPIPANVAPPSFTDESAVSTWALAAVIEAAMKGLMSGYPDGAFRPQAPLTRAEAAVLIGRLKP